MSLDLNEPQTARDGRGADITDQRFDEKQKLKSIAAEWETSPQLS
jgi:hypothetical protein